MTPHLTMAMNNSSTSSKLALTISNTCSTSTSTIEYSDSSSAVSTPSKDLESDVSEFHVTNTENMIGRRGQNKESLLKDPFNSDVLETFNLSLEDKTSVSSDNFEPSTAISEEINNLVNNFRTTSLTDNEFNDVTERFRNLELLDGNSKTAPLDSSKESNCTLGDVDNVRHECSNENQEIVNSSFDNAQMNGVNIFKEENDTETKTDDSQDHSSSDEDNYDLRSRAPDKKISRSIPSISTPYERLNDATQIDIHYGVNKNLEVEDDKFITDVMSEIFMPAGNKYSIPNIPYPSNTQFTGTDPITNNSVLNPLLPMTDQPNIMSKSYGNYQPALGDHNTEMTTNIENIMIYFENNSPSPSNVQPPNISSDIPGRSPSPVSLDTVQSPIICQNNLPDPSNSHDSDTQVFQSERNNMPQDMLKHEDTWSGMPQCNTFWNVQTSNACKQACQSYTNFNQMPDFIEQTQNNLSSQPTPTNVPSVVSNNLESRKNLLDLDQNAKIRTHDDIPHIEQTTPIRLPASSTTTSTATPAPKTYPGKVDVRRLLSLPVTDATRRLVQELSEEHLFNAMTRVLLKSIKELTSVDDAKYTPLMHLVKDADQMKNKRYRAYFIALVERIGNIPGSLSAMNDCGEDALYLAAINCPKMACISGYLAAAMVKRRIVISHNLYKGGDTLIHVVAAKGDTHIEVLSELLALKTNEGNRVFDLSKVNYYGKTALHIAVEAHNNMSKPRISSIDTVQLLLKHGINSTIKETEYCRTALHQAVHLNCDVDLIKALLSCNGSQANDINDIYGYTPRDYASIINVIWPN